VNIYSRMTNSLKWSSVTEILVKLITPISNMILARLLSPEEFGVVATITMVISFADVLTDAGFQKYIVQHIFKNDEELDNATNVAFWSNFCFSLALWGGMFIVRDKIASLVGSPGLGNAIAIAGVSIPLTAFSSIQSARLRRDFHYKKLFLIRFGTLFIPLAVTVPLAAMGLSYWALIIGTIAGNLYNAITMTVYSKWKPGRYYNFELLKKMFSYCAWTLCDSLCVWLTAWLDTFFVGTELNSYYLGLYKNSLSTVNGIFTLISASVSSVLFVSLSKIQSEKQKMVKLFQTTQVMLALLTIPLGAGILIYRDLVTKILLGSNWADAPLIIGVWAVACVFRISFISINGELYRASGHPRIPFLLQLLDLVLLIPTCVYGLQMGFWNFVFLRALLRLDLLIPNVIIMYKLYDAKIKEYIPTYVIICIATGVMAILGIAFVKISGSILWQLISILICMVVYAGIIMAIPKTRRYILNLRRFGDM